MNELPWREPTIFTDRVFTKNKEQEKAVLNDLRSHLKTTEHRDLALQVILLTEALCMALDEIEAQHNRGNATSKLTFSLKNARQWIYGKISKFTCHCKFF
jgi:hypothetical protein